MCVGANGLYYFRSNLIINQLGREDGWKVVWNEMGHVVLVGSKVAWSCLVKYEQRLYKELLLLATCL